MRTSFQNKSIISEHLCDIRTFKPFQVILCALCEQPVITNSLEWLQNGDERHAHIVEKWKMVYNRAMRRKHRCQADGLSTRNEYRRRGKIEGAFPIGLAPMSTRKERRMKLKIDPPRELQELSDTMRSILTGLAALAMLAIAMSTAAILIALGGRSNGNH